MPCRCSFIGTRCLENSTSDVVPLFLKLIKGQFRSIEILWEILTTRTLNVILPTAVID